jgi:hypothetical protein
MPSPVADGPAQAVEVLRNVEDVLPIEQVFPSLALVLLEAGRVEVVAWSAALRYAGVLPTWPAAAAFAAAAFT